MDTPTRIREAFAQAVELPPERREDCLRQACGDDPELRAAVLSLLNAHDHAGEFLADPVIDPARLHLAAAVAPGAQIGPYTIIRLIGEGGYGAVFLAEQQAPLRRHVALKLIKPGMDSRLILARFEAERQALALMEHPNIARVYDGGMTPSGHPYFVMEYVDGPSITSFCTTKGLSIPDRLALFAKVCMAVQHAHQKGIIHRDLKPANILIATQDGAPAPKIIDFGIAKALQSPLTGHTAATAPGQFLGTPQYMSPEQAGAASDIDTRTDIYALGAILYELLTGTPAFDLAELRAAAVDEFHRIIREVDPPKPSTRVLTLTQCASGNLPPDAKTARKTAHLMRGELDWIVMKSMEKDRSRRYETAESLANDIRRYLADEPVAAGPPGSLYRLTKFTRRHRVLIAAGAAVVLSLVVGLTLASMALARANRDRERALAAQRSEAAALVQARQQRALAEANQLKAEAQTKQLLVAQTFLYRLLAPTRDIDPEVPPRELLDYAAKKIAAAGLDNHPEVQGPVYAALGAGYYRYGLLAQSQTQWRAALDCFRRLDPGDNLNLASALNNTADTLLLQRKFDDAEPLLRESLAMYRRLYHKDDLADAPVRRNLAVVLASQKHYQEAAELMQSALSDFLSSYGHRSRVVADVLDKLADILEQQGQLDAALQRRQEAAAIRAELHQ